MKTAIAAEDRFENILYTLEQMSPEEFQDFLIKWRRLFQ